MDSRLSGAQNAPPDILSLIFDRIEYGERLKDEWEKLDQRCIAGGTKSLLSIVQICRSWRAAALPYFYQVAETLLLPVWDEARYYPALVYPNLSLSAAAGHSQFVRSARFFLSLDHIIDGTSTTMLNSGAFSQAIFPNVTDLVLNFYSSNAIPQGNHSARIGSFIEHIYQMFPNAQNSSSAICSGWWAGEEDMCKDLMGLFTPTPRTFIFRELSHGGITLHGGPSTGIRRMYLKIDYTSNFPIMHSNRDTIEELILHIAPENSYHTPLEVVSDDLASFFCYTYPKLTSLSIDTHLIEDGRFSMPDANPFPSLTSLSIFTHCDIDISVIVDDISKNLTSLTIYPSVLVLESLRGRVFPKLTHIRFLLSGSAFYIYDMDKAMEAAYLPFFIAPNAELIECRQYSFGVDEPLPYITPPNHINPRLRHLIIGDFIPSLSEFQRILSCFPGLVRIGVDGVRSDEGDPSNLPDNEISRLLAELPIFSTCLRRIDFQEWWTINSFMAIAITKLPALRMIDIVADRDMLDQYKREISRSVYDEYHDSLSRPLLSENVI